MLAAAGIVVTLISTPISAPDLAVQRLSMPGRARADGDDERERVRARDALGERVVGGVEGVGDEVGAVEDQRGEHGRADREREADDERRAPSGARARPRVWTTATQRPATGPNSGPTTIAPTTRIGVSRKIPIAAMIAARTM